MDDWQPTLSLRFVFKYAERDDLPGFMDTSRRVRILQQLWRRRIADGFDEEWRDVPIDREA